MKDNGISEIFIVFITLFCISCSSQNDNFVTEKKKYDFRYFHIELPKGYYVKKNIFSRDSFWADTIKDFRNVPVLFFSYGENSKCFNKSEEFEEVSRFDTYKEIEKNKILVRYIHLSGLRIPKEKGSWAWPFCLDFYYYPDQVDSSVCEEIIRSAKIHSFNKDYLCTIYKTQDLFLEGEKMSELRRLPLDDFFTLSKFFELTPIENRELFMKKGKYLFLADCYLNNEYKGSFYVNESCDFEWNGKPADAEDIEDLFEIMNDERIKKIRNKCNI